MNITFLLYPIAIYYFADASVRTSAHIVDKLQKDSWFKNILSNKPFSCVFCMCFWWSLVLYFMPITVIKIIAIAGIAYIVSCIVERLNTIFLGD